MAQQQQQRQLHMYSGQYNNVIDTTYTKLFVGGLAWETKRDTMRRYFEQFGEIIEAVVITDKNTGRSKGYGFVTFKDPEAAMRACQNPSPVIDGRRANCNLASLGAQKPPPPHQQGAGRFRAVTAGLMAQQAFHGGGSSSSYMNPSPSQFTFPYSSYGYTGYSQDTMYSLSYYGLYYGQQFSPYYGASATAPGSFHNFYPYYPQYAQNSNQAHIFGVHYPQMLQYPYLPPHQVSSGTLSLPSTMAMASSTTGATTMATTTTPLTVAMTMTTTTTLPTTITTTTPPTTTIAAVTTRPGGAATEQSSSTK